MEFLYPELDLNMYFDKVFISGYHHIAKPDLRIYSMCVEAFNMQFNNIYMIDDNMKNLSDLDKISIQPILYKNNEELFKIIK